MIRSILALAAKLRGKTQPPAISPQDVNALRELISHDSWPVYQRLLEEVIEVHAEAMLTTDASPKLHYLRGLILGLREASLYPERLAAQKAHEYRSREHDRSNARAASLYATSAWNG